MKLDFYCPNFNSSSSPAQGLLLELKSTPSTISRTTDRRHISAKTNREKAPKSARNFGRRGGRYSGRYYYIQLEHQKFRLPRRRKSCPFYFNGSARNFGRRKKIMALLHTSFEIALVGFAFRRFSDTWTSRFLPGARGSEKV